MGILRFPPNPDDPRIEATLTNPLLDAIKGNLTDSQQDGIILVDENTCYPEVVDVEGPRSIVISDCREIHPDSGVYEANGEKLEDTPRPVNRDRVVIEMQLTDEGWKAAATREFVHGDDCAHAPTPAGRAHI